jgi:hypothetical protein
MLGNWVRETTTTTGTGDLTLSSVSGYPTFNNVFSTSRYFAYAILNDSDGTPIECGIGYLSASTTLVRSKITATYSSGTFDDTSPSAISLSSGTKRVICAGNADAILTPAKNVNRNSSISTNKYVSSQHVITSNASSTGFTPVVNTLYLLPFWLCTSIEVDALCVRVGTGAATKSVRMGIYDIDSTGHASKLLAETGSLSAATSSTEAVGTFTAIRLQPGWYYVAIVSDGTPALGRMTSGGTLPGFFGVQTSNMLIDLVGINSAHTYGALPNPAPTSGFNQMTGGTAVPAIFLRAV